MWKRFQTEGGKTMTIKDIARLSGCGVATVSRVLNGRPDVSRGTRDRVLAVVEEHGFQLNRNAKQLKQQMGTDIAILVKGSQNMLFAGIAERAQAMLRSRGRDAAVYYLDEEADEVSYACRLCREQKPLGLLFMGGDLDCFKAGFGQISVPSVLLTNSARGLGFDNLSSLTTDDEAAAAQVIEHLAKWGHRRIGVLGGFSDSSQISALRLRGCRTAFARLGLPFDEGRQLVCSRFVLEDAYRAAGQLVDRAPEVTAIFAMSDVMAIGAVRALADRGKRVPRDMSVVGYDGISLADYCVPRLTTVQQDGEGMADRGVELLLERLDGRREPVYNTVPFRLVEGESVAPPAAEVNDDHRKKEEEQP